MARTRPYSVRIHRLLLAVRRLEGPDSVLVELAYQRRRQASLQRELLAGQAIVTAIEDVVARQVAAVD